MQRKRDSIGVGVIGFGTIGTGVVRVLQDHREQIARRIGVPVELVRVADLDTRTSRGVRLRKGVLINDANALIQDQEVDVVVELIGGIEPARSFHRAALDAGKAVVTANKALLSQYGPVLVGKAETKGAGYGFEASVAGGIPIIRTLATALAGDRTDEVFGIVNGTANYILTEMAAGRGEFADVLRRAQEMGLAEADPTYDVDGLDSLHKLVVLVAMAFGKKIRPKAVHCEGIREISGIDMEYAREFGYRIKLLAVARDTPEGVEARVHPTMVPESHLLAKVDGAFNAVCLRGAALGTSLYYGQGAGMMPTATAVVADILDAARNRILGGELPPPYGQPAKSLESADVVPMAGLSSEHYLRFHVRDEPGVLARIASTLADEDISIATVAQHEKPSRGMVPIVVRTHRAEEASLRRALSRVARSKACKAKPVAIRVEESLGEGS